MGYWWCCWLKGWNLFMIYYVWYNNLSFSESDVTHIPVSCVKVEEVEASIISNLFCSAEGVCYLADKGLQRIYRVELETGNCLTFGQKFIGKHIFQGVHILGCTLFYETGLKNGDFPIEGFCRSPPPPNPNPYKLNASNQSNNVVRPWCLGPVGLDPAMYLGPLGFGP